ncbi:MAG: nitrite reductase [Marmoricola sp.]
MIRIRLVGGHLSGAQLSSVLDVAEGHGDGDIHLTTRANLQVRGFAPAARLPEQVVAAIEATGLLPSRRHELIRNILVSPQTGFGSGRADLRPLAAELDRLLLADDRLSSLPGRFLFVFDDGRGDLVERQCDLGLVALDGARVQLRIGDAWGPVVDLKQAPAHLVALARRFLEERPAGPAAPWHIRERAEPLVPACDREPGVPHAIGPLGYGRVDGGYHHRVAGGILDRVAASALLSEPVLVVTPWRGVFVPDHPEQS